MNYTVESQEKDKAETLHLNVYYQTEEEKQVQLYHTISGMVTKCQTILSF